MSNLPGVSIIMTPYKRKALLEITLATIWAQNYPDIEIVVVEDRPSEASLEAFCKRNNIKYDARRSQIEGWMNPAVLQNRGLRMSTKEIVILQNAEVRHDKLDNIVRLVEPIKKAQVDQEPAVSSFACVQSLNKDGSFEQWFCHPKLGARAGWMSPFCQALSRDVIFKIGGVNEAYINGYGFEDDDLEMRLRFAGVRLHPVTETLCSHMWHERFDGDQRNGNEEIYKLTRREIEMGVRTFEANVGKEWGSI